MAGWKVPQYKTVPMPDDIADGLWIKIHHPRRLPKETVDHYFVLARRLGADTADFDVDTACDFCAAMIVDWNFPEDDKDGAIAKLPSQDASVWDKIPALEVINVVFDAMRQGVQEAQPDPNS